MRGPGVRRLSAASATTSLSTARSQLAVQAAGATSMERQDGDVYAKVLQDDNKHRRASSTSSCRLRCPSQAP
jgi:hypothetical protein